MILFTILGGYAVCCRHHILQCGRMGARRIEDASSHCRAAARRQVRQPLGRLAATLVLAAGAASLAGCGLGDGIGALMVDPAHYDAYHCKDLVAEARALARRETELRNLIDTARQGRGGAVIGALAYGDTYEAVLEKEKLVRRVAAQKNCRLASGEGDDRFIR